MWLDLWQETREKVFVKIMCAGVDRNYSAQRELDEVDNLVKQGVAHRGLVRVRAVFRNASIWVCARPPPSHG